MTAVLFQNVPVIHTLLAIPGIDVTAKDDSGITALDIALYIGDQEIIKLLTPYYTTLKGLSIEAVKKAREQGKITQEEIEQRLPQELQEELRK